MSDNHSLLKKKEMSTFQIKTSYLVSRDQRCQPRHVTALPERRPQRNSPPASAGGMPTAARCSRSEATRAAGAARASTPALEGAEQQARSGQVSKPQREHCPSVLSRWAPPVLASFWPLCSLQSMTGKERNVSLGFPTGETSALLQTLKGQKGKPRTGRKRLQNTLSHESLCARFTGTLTAQ